MRRGGGRWDADLGMANTQRVSSVCSGAVSTSRPETISPNMPCRATVDFGSISRRGHNSCRRPQSSSKVGVRGGAGPAVMPASRSERCMRCARGAV